MPVGRVGLAAAGIGALALVIAAIAPAGPDPWQDAAAQAPFPIYRPSVTLGFTPGPIVVEGCFDRSYGRVRTSYSRGTGDRRAVFGFEENYPQFCGDAGDRMTVASANVNGVQVPVQVYCYSPGPRCTAADGFANGFHIELRPPGPKQPMIAVYSSRVALSDLLRVVRSLARVPRAVVDAPAAPVAARPCSKTEAVKVVRRLHLGDDSLPDPVYEVICGSFTGPGSQTMVVSLATGGTSVPFGGWAVLQVSDGTWQLVMQQRDGAKISVVASGIKQTVWVSRPGDSRCCPSGGTRARIWRWDGSRLVIGPWKQDTPAATTAPAGATRGGHFMTPSGNIFCAYFAGAKAAVECVIRSAYRPPLPRRGPSCSRSYWVELGASGRVETGGSVCPGEDDPEGPFIGAEQARVLPYGKTWSSGSLRCTSAVTGLTCRNKSGHGFFLSRENWRAF